MSGPVSGPVSAKETALKGLLVWLAVYPSVTLVSYAFGWLGIDWPLFAEILVSTALTVPLITFVVQPTIMRRMAMARGQATAGLMRAQAAQADAREEEEAEDARRPRRALA